MLADSETGAPDLWSQRGNTDGKTSPITQRHGTLSFKFGANVEDVGHGERCSFRSRTIKLPVANTIFHNGRESTIQAQRWIVDENVVEPTLACVKRTWLKEQVLQMAFPCPDEPNKFPLQVAVPLSALTGRKRVATSMGNVIRQFYAGNEPFPDQTPRNSQPEAEPASMDLEGAIAQFILTPGNKKKEVEVWALIRSPTSLQKYHTPDASNVIKCGGHFHKVLSGGGGWGNKQGLIALDPEIDFDITPELRLTEDLEMDPPGKDRGRASGQIVNPGDVATFFSLRSFNPPFKWTFETPQAPTDPGNSWILSRSPCFVFGTVSSTIDAMPVTHSPRARFPDSPPCIYVAKHFGMLSEQAVSLTLVRSDGEVSRTKIDVPHAIVSYGARADRLQTKPLLYEQTSKPPNSMQHRVHSEDMSDGAAASEPRSEYLVNSDTISGSKHQAEGLTVKEAIAESLCRRVHARGMIASDVKTLVHNAESPRIRKHVSRSLEGSRKREPRIRKHISREPRIRKHVLREPRIRTYNSNFEESGIRGPRIRKSGSTRQRAAESILFRRVQKSGSIYKKVAWPTRARQVKNSVVNEPRIRKHILQVPRIKRYTSSLEDPSKRGPRISKYSSIYKEAARPTLFPRVKKSGLIHKQAAKATLVHKDETLRTRQYGSSYEKAAKPTLVQGVKKSGAKRLRIRR
ncbi:MAG: hypothetical protein Q9182_002112 [Xanthomendoza sp. 2 TL-2023]